MFRPDTIHLRRSDAETLERLVAPVSFDRMTHDALALLQEELERATIVADDALPSDAVALGSRVRFQDRHADREREITLVVPSQAAADQGRILSPVGSALIGLSVGDEIHWPTPGGTVRRLRVLAVSSGE